MIIGKSLTALGGGGLKPEIRVTAKAGALLNLHFKNSSIILQSYQLGASETTHTFVVNVSETAYVVEDVTNSKIVEVLVDSVAVFNTEFDYNRVLNGDFTNGYDNWSFVGTGTSPSYWYKELVTSGSKNYLKLGVDGNQTYSVQQTVDFTGASELSFMAQFQGGTSESSFIVYVGSTAIFTAVYGTSIGSKTISVSYSGAQTLKFTAKKTSTSGNSMQILIGDISVK